MSRIAQLCVPSSHACGREISFFSVCPVVHSRLLGIVVLVDKIEIDSDGKSAVIKPTQNRSYSLTELTSGDVACVPAGTLHWLGALENNSNEEGLFSHLAIRKRTDEETIWF